MDKINRSRQTILSETKFSVFLTTVGEGGRGGYAVGDKLIQRLPVLRA